MLRQGFSLLIAMSKRRLTDSPNKPKANPAAPPWSTLYVEVVGVVSALLRCQVLLYTLCICEYCHYQYIHSINENTEVYRDRIKTKTKPQPQDDTASREAKIEGGAIYPTALEVYFLCPSTRVLLRWCHRSIQAHPRGTAQLTRSSTARIRGRQQGFLSNYTTHLRILVFDV